MMGQLSHKWLSAVAVTACLLAAAAVQAEPPSKTSTEPSLELAFEETVMLGPDQAVGSTSIGGRNIVPITGGSFEGDHLKGRILPGGWDWQLLRADGCRFLHADYMLKTEDGAVINVVNQGVSCPNADGSRAPVRTMAVFEPPLGPYEWLGKSAFIGTLQAVQVDGKRAVHIRFFRVR